MEWNEFVIAMLEEGAAFDGEELVCPECQDAIYEEDYDYSNMCPICEFEVGGR